MLLPIQERIQSQGDYLTYLLQGLVTKYARRVSNLGGSVGYATLLGIPKSLAGYDAIRSLLSSSDQLI